MLLLIASTVLTIATSKIRAQGAGCEDLPQVNLTEDVQVSAEHAIWVLVKRETAGAQSYIRINDGSCIELTTPSNDEWQWVSGNDGRIEEYLTADLNYFNLSVEGGSILMDKLLVTNDTGCVPTGDGKNCLDIQIEFNVNGLSSGETVSGTRIVSASLLSPAENATIEFSINGEVVSTQTSEPFCLQAGNGSCAPYDFAASGLEPGNHTLSVRGFTNEGSEFTRNIPFTLAGATVPITNPTTPPATPPSTPSAPQASSIEIRGVRDAEVVSNDITVEGIVNGAVNEVTFYINDKPYSVDRTAPFCMVGTDSACAPFSTKSLPNTTYVITASVKLPNGSKLEDSARITVNNVAPKPPEEPKKQEVVVGRPKQQATGIITATVPKERTTNASTVTYKVNDKPVATVPASNPKTTIDTSKFTNGPSTVTATVNKNNGETEVLKSNVQVKNDAVTSSSNWFRDNIALVMGLLMVLSVGLFFGIRYGIERYRMYKLQQMHNLADSYTFVQPQEQAQFQNQAYGSLAVMMVMTVGVLSMTRFGSTAIATGLGFIKEVEETSQALPSGYSLVTQSENTDIYVRLNYTRPTTPNPAPPTNPPVQPPTSDANILYETFEGNGTNISNGTPIDGSNSLARLNYFGIPVAGYCIYDLNPCYSVPDERVRPAFDSSVRVSGTYSARFAMISVGRDTQAGSFYHQSFDRANAVYSRFWWRFDENMANAGGNPSILHWRGDYGEGPQYADIRFGGNRTLNLVNRGGGSADGGYQYSANTWYDVSLELQSSSGLSRLVVRDQSGTVLQDMSHTYPSQGTIGFIEFGVLGGYSPSYSQISSMWFDDFRMSTNPIGSTAPANPTPPTPPPAPAPNPTPPNPPPVTGGVFEDNLDSGGSRFNGPTGRGVHVFHPFTLPVFAGGVALVNPAERAETIAQAPGTYSVDQYAEADIIFDGGTSETGVSVRSDITDPDYYWYRFEVAYGSLRIASIYARPQWGVLGFYQCSNGTRLDTGRHRLRLEARGNELIGYVDGVARIRCVDNSNRQSPAAGNPAFHIQGPAATIDNFRGGNLTEPPTGPLPELQELQFGVERAYGT